MILPSFATGFALGFSLILAIGAQNAFVLRQGLMRRHVLPVVLFCSLADMLLIVAGVAGISLLIADLASRHAPVLFGCAAVWLAGYGVLRVRSALVAGGISSDNEGEAAALLPTLATVAVLTFGNPHVYLDTVVLIGTVSLQFDGANRIAYGAGAATSSVVFFFQSWLLCNIAGAADGTAQCLAHSGYGDRAGHVRARHRDGTRWRLAWVMPRVVDAGGG